MPYDTISGNPIQANPVVVIPCDKSGSGAALCLFLCISICYGAVRHRFHTIALGGTGCVTSVPGCGRSATRWDWSSSISWKADYSLWTEVPRHAWAETAVLRLNSCIHWILKDHVISCNLGKVLNDSFPGGLEIDGYSWIKAISQYTYFSIEKERDNRPTLDQVSQNETRQELFYPDFKQKLQVIWTWGAFCSFTCNCASERRALVRRFNVRRWFENGVFYTFDLEMCYAPLICATLDLPSDHMAPNRRLPSLRCNPPEPQITGKTRCFATLLPFRAHAASFFSHHLTSSQFFSSLICSLLLSSALLVFDSSLFPPREAPFAHTLGSFTSKLLRHIYIDKIKLVMFTSKRLRSIQRSFYHSWEEANCQSNKDVRAARFVHPRSEIYVPSRMDFLFILFTAPDTLFATVSTLWWSEFSALWRNVASTKKTFFAN